MQTMAELDSLSKKFSDAYEDLSDQIRDLNQAIENLNREYWRSIKKAADQVAEKKAKLEAAIVESPGLFDSPRTMIMHGVKFGFMKGKGKIKIEDEENTCKLIKRNFPELAEILIITKESASKNALADLPAADLKKIGVTVEETGDIPVVNVTDGAIQKLVKTFLKKLNDEFEAVSG